MKKSTLSVSSVQSSGLYSWKCQIQVKIMINDLIFTSTILYFQGKELFAASKLSARRCCGYVVTLCKSNRHFCNVTWNAEENEILHDIFREVSRCPSYISYYIAENRLPFGQCVLCSTQTVEAVFQGSNLTCITVTLKDGRVLIN